MAGFDVGGSGGGSSSGAAAEPTVVQGGNLGATETVNMSGETYVHYHGTLDANCAVTVTNLTEGDRIDFFFTQDGTGGRTVTIDDGGGAVACSVGSAASTTTKIECTYNGTDLLFEAPGSSTVPDYYRQLLAASGRASTSGASGTKYLLGVISGSDAASVGSGAVQSPFLYSFAAADHDVTGKTTVMRVKGVIQTVTAPTINVTVGLYPATAGASVSAGTVVPSSEFTVTTPAANSLTTGASADFTIPADGVYLLGYTLSGTPAGALLATARLELRNV